MARPITFFLLIALAGVALIAAFNRAVDPLEQFEGPRIAGWNAVKSETFKYDRDARHAAILRLRPDCLLVGSSRVAVGFDAHDAALAECQRPYNAGLAGATLGEVEELVALASRDTPPRLVIISLDLFMFNATRAPRATGLDEAGCCLRPLRYLVSTSTLGASIDTVRSQSAPGALEPDGDVRDAAFGQTLEYMGNHRALFLRGLQGYIGHNLPPPYYRFSYTDGSRDSLASLRRMIAARYAIPGARTVVAFSPAHAWQWQLLRTIGLEEQWRDFKRRTVVIVDEEALRAGQEPFRVFDFAVFGPVQSEPVPELADSAARVSGYWDASHFRKTTGSLALQAMVSADTGTAVSPLGERVDGASIEAHLRSVDLAAQAWREANPALVEEINSLVACYAPATLARRLPLAPAPESTCRNFRLITR